MSNLGQETNKINSIVSVLVAVSLSLLLTACGGGGGAAVAPEPPDTGNMDGNTGDNGDGGTDDGDGSMAGGGSGGGSGSGDGTDNGDGNGNGNGGGTLPDDGELTEAQMVQGYRDDAKEAEVEVPAILYRAAVETGSNLLNLESEQVIAGAMGVSTDITAEASAQVEAMKAGIAKVEEDLDAARQTHAELDAEAESLTMEGVELAGEAAEADIEKMQAEQALTAAGSVYNPLHTAITDLEKNALAEDVKVANARAELARLKAEDPGNSSAIGIQEALIEAASMAAAEDRMEAEAKRMEQEYIDAKNAFEAATQAEAEARAEAERLIADSRAKVKEAMDKADEVAEVAGYITEIEASLTNLENAVGADIERWDTLLGNVSDQEKAKMVFALLDHSEGGSQALPVINLTGDLMDLDTSAHVFLRAAPEGTMTFRQIAEGNNEWGLSSRTFRNSNNSVNTVKHTETGLPPGHYAINFQGPLKLADFEPITTGSFGAGSFLPVGNDPNNPAAGSYPSFTSANRYHFFHGKLNGMEGTLYCDRSNGCSVDSLNGERHFISGWYFAPDVSSARQGTLGYDPRLSRYMDSDGNGVYELVENYIDYGLWLEGTDDSLTLNGRIGWVGTTDVSVSNLNFGVSNRSLAGNATYSGDAHGLSARRVGTGDDRTTASGHFVADVELLAIFGAIPTLNGTIDNFRAVAGSGHVDPAWSIPLTATVPAVIPAGRIGEDIRGGYYDGNKVVHGRWGWQAYGEMGNDQGQRFQQRPTGFFGDFETLFYDADENLTGAAAGFYHAEKE